MDKQQLIKILKEEGDTEEMHIQADLALLSYINDGEITQAFNSVGKWYA